MPMNGMMNNNMMMNPMMSGMPKSQYNMMEMAPGITLDFSPMSPFPNLAADKKPDALAAKKPDDKDKKKEEEQI